MKSEKQPELTDRDKLYIVFSTFDEVQKPTEAQRLRVFIDAIQFGDRLFVFSADKQQVERVLQLNARVAHARTHLGPVAKRTLEAIHSYYLETQKRPSVNKLSHHFEVSESDIQSRLHALADHYALFLPWKRRFDYRVIL